MACCGDRFVNEKDNVGLLVTGDTPGGVPLLVRRVGRPAEPGVPNPAGPPGLCAPGSPPTPTGLRLDVLASSLRLCTLLASCMLSIRALVNCLV